MTNFSETTKEIPVWERLCSYRKTEEAEAFDETRMVETLMADKIRLLDALAVMQVSVAYRAVRACDLYFDWMKKRQGTDKQTYMRPRVRIDSRYLTVEMSWVRRLSKSKPAVSGGVSKAAKGSKIGRSFQIKTENGTLDVFSWYEYLKRGAKDRYSNAIFKKEPLWVQKLGPEVEDRFELLRKEQKTINSMKRLVGTLDVIQQKQFDERVVQELKSRMGENFLKALYKPNIVLDQSSDEGTD